MKLGQIISWAEYLRLNPMGHNVTNMPKVTITAAAERPASGCKNALIALLQHVQANLGLAKTTRWAFNSQHVHHTH